MEDTIAPDPSEIVKDMMLYEAFCTEAEDDIVDYQMASLFAFTWTPNPMYYSSYAPREQYLSLLQILMGKLKKCFTEFLFTPELNSSGYVHLHGWFMLKDKVKFYRDLLPRLRHWGFIVLKHGITGKWFEYCRKEVDSVNAIIGDDLPIPLTHKNYDYYYHKLFRNVYAKPFKMLKYKKNLLPKTKDIRKFFINK